MTQNSDFDGVSVLISIFLNQEYYVELTEDVAEIIFQLIRDNKDSLVVSHSDGKIGFNIPYHKVAMAIFEHNSPLSVESLEDFISAVHSVLVVKQEESVLVCFNKLSRHILLAIIQKNFMVDSAKDADMIASVARERADFAYKQAKKAKKMSSKMITNFVTILGVFATIIITVFGGINIIEATIKLLEGNNRLVYLVFVVSFLMICLLTLVGMLTSWISSLNELEDDDLPNSQSKKKMSFYKKAILWLAAALVASAACIIFFQDKEGAVTKEEGKSKSSTQSNVVVINTESNKPTEQPKTTEAKKE